MTDSHDAEEPLVGDGGGTDPADAGSVPGHDSTVGQAGPAGHAGHAGHAGQGPQGGRGSDEPGGYDEYDIAELTDASGAEHAMDTDVHPDTKRADEHRADLQRLQAEYVNYKRRVDRDRDVARDRGVTQVIEALLPVLDDIHLARKHGDLDGGPFASISDKLDAVLARFGVTRIGVEGEAFDPAVHEALMHVEADLDEGATTTTVVAVLQPGYTMGERVIRPARVSVADPT